MLLLDEPFGALDAKIRQELRRWLRRLHDEVHVTSVFVTHDQEEALEVADRVVVMNRGRIEQIGTPDEVYDHPATPFVFEFLGHVNRLPLVAGSTEQVFARPHEFAVLTQPAVDALPARLVHSATVGPVSRLEFALEPDRQTINVELPRATFRALATRARGDRLPATDSRAPLQRHCDCRLKHRLDGEADAPSNGRGIMWWLSAAPAARRRTDDAATVSPSSSRRAAELAAGTPRASCTCVRVAHVGRFSAPWT